MAVVNLHPALGGLGEGCKRGEKPGKEGGRGMREVAGVPTPQAKQELGCGREVGEDRYLLFIPL